MDQLARETVVESVKTEEHPTPDTNKKAMKGLKIPLSFCPEEQNDPFETVEWELRTAAIKGDGGEVIFEQNDCEVPVFWSQLATNVVANKYLYGEVGTGERETGVRQLIHRVCRTIADWGQADGYFATEADGERFYRDLTWLCLHQHASFNSPVWFNVGLYHQYGVEGAACNWHWSKETGRVEQPENPYEFPQASACFIQSVQDNMEDIMELARSEAMLFKFGSGTGTDVSTLRSQREKLSGGGRPSGPLSFMRVYDQIAAVVKSGGKTRRAAKMQSIKDWHPDVMEFIECKGREEKKVRTAGRGGIRSAGSLRHRDVPELQFFHPAERRVHALGRLTDKEDFLGPRIGSPIRARTARRIRRQVRCSTRSPRRLGCAAIRACNTTRRSTAGTHARPRAGSTPVIRVVNICSSMTRPAIWRASI